MVMRQRPELADESIGAAEDAVELLYGYTCPSGAFLPEPDASAARSAGRSGIHSARPGSRVPHVRLAGPHGWVCPRELLGPHFLVFTTMADGAAGAREVAAELGVDLVAHRVDSTEPLGAGPAGTVLVRPDGVVAWRGGGTHQDDTNQLTKALRSVLHR
jgi:putative polyketide hydroxylase